jgi:chromate reductase
MPQPELYLGQAAALFDAEGRLASESVRLLFTQFLTRFAAWTDANRPR